jgi:ATP-dependent protease Clp ATPase subunit
MSNPIVGQEQVVNQVNKIFKIFKGSNTQIRPHFILTGPSGSGKTLTVNTLAKQHDVGFIQINAAGLTKEGTSGNSLSKALSPLIQVGTKPTVVFVDEFDKLFIAGNSNSEVAHETTVGVQNEFLTVLESDTASVFGDYGKYVNVSAKNLLFVFAGAFNNEREMSIDRLREIGLKTEFLGRVGLVFNTDPLTLEELYAIVDRSELLNKYVKLFADVDREKVTYEIKGYLKTNYENNTLGSRLIDTLINTYFISGGLSQKKVEEVAFQTKLTL